MDGYKKEQRILLAGAGALVIFAIFHIFSIENNQNMELEPSEARQNAEYQRNFLFSKSTTRDHARNYQKRLAFEKLKLKEYQKDFPLVLDFRGLSPQAMSFFQIDEKASEMIKDAIESARSSLQNQIVSGMEKTEIPEIGGVEYRVPAFPEAGNVIQMHLRECINEVIGNTYGDEAIKSIDTDFAHFFGWGRFDMKFLITSRNANENDERASRSAWNLSLTYYIPGTEREAAHITIPLDEAIPVIGIFEDSTIFDE